MKGKITFIEKHIWKNKKGEEVDYWDIIVDSQPDTKMSCWEQKARELSVGDEIEYTANKNDKGYWRLSLGTASGEKKPYKEYKGKSTGFSHPETMLTAYMKDYIVARMVNWGAPIVETDRIEFVAEAISVVRDFYREARKICKETED